VKNHDFTPKNHIFSNFRRARAPGAPPPGSAPASGDKLYYTNYYENTVTYCDLHDTIQWELYGDRVLIGPCGISVDNAGNVYVIGCDSNNVVVQGQPR
jgi:hypothetical protein